MPLELSNIQSEVTLQINAVKVISHFVFSDEIECGQMMIVINYVEGNLTNGVFKKLNKQVKSITLEDADFLSTAFSQVTQGTLYDNLKNILYAKLKEKVNLTGTIV